MANDKKNIVKKTNLTSMGIELVSGMREVSIAIPLQQGRVYGQ